jgi:hypothetical protein
VLLAVSVAVALGLLLLASRLHAARPDAPLASAGAGERLAAVDVARAADVLSDQAGRRRRELGAALMPGEEAALVELLRLQAEAADLALGDVRFTPLSRDGLVQPVEMVLDLEGAYYDVPLFVDGLYRQSRVVEVRSVTLEAPTPMATRIRARIEARLWRPYALDAAAMVRLLAAGPPVGEFSTQALASAATLETYDAFDRAVPGIQARAAQNRRLVLRTIPTLVRRLPGSPMDWVGATFDGGEARVALEPGR